jgi:hypothetical protein
LLNKIETSADVSCLFTLENIAILIGQEDGYMDVMSPFDDKIIIHDRHPFCEKITCIIQTTRKGECELAVVTAG